MKRSIVSVALFALLFLSLGFNFIGSKSAYASISSAFPYYIDSDTGSKVYQITNQDGLNSITYYHQNPFIDNDWLLVKNLNNSLGQGYEYSKINIRTGIKTIVASRGTANGDNVFRDKLYAFHFINGNNGGDAWLGRLDLNTLQWEHFVYRDHSEDFFFAGGIAVNNDQTKIIWNEQSKSKPYRFKVQLFDMTSRQVFTLYEGADRIEHMVFSPTDPHLFTYINQDAGFKLGRVGIGDASQKRMEPLKLEGTYWTYPYFNMAHPFWSVDGKLYSDVLWHPNNPMGTYNLVSFDFTAIDPFGIVPSSKQTNRFIDNYYWNAHFNNNKSLLSDWFVGDGDPGNSGGQLYTNIFNILPSGKVRFTPIAKIQGVLPSEVNPCAHLLPSRDGVVMTWNHNIGSFNSAQNVFLAEISTQLQNEIISSETPQLQWHFDQTGDLEGWSMAHDINGNTNEWRLDLMINGNDPFILSPENLNIDAVSNRFIKIRMKNSTSKTLGQIYFITENDTNWDENKSESFSILPSNYTDYTEYIVDMGNNKKWIGKIKQLRIDPVTTGMIGETLSIDYITISNLSAQKNWNFNIKGNDEGWSAFNQMTRNVSDGILSLEVTGTDPYMISSDYLSIDAVNFKFMKIRLKNNSNKSLAQLYFVTNSDGTWDEAKSVAFPIKANSDYTDYIVNLSSNSSWSGTIKQIRLDPITTGNIGDKLFIDYIRILD
ncbi:hypothetical protein [Paenibacillus sp. A3]|uniref:hypothetical protein n=1 Tax=Paenibacillus sp. A3 TaxID=1337054 RepID=UPI000B15816F|nr:hypothetical protein [Paenibacillus sp. A3]